MAHATSKDFNGAKAVPVPDPKPPRGILSPCQTSVAGLTIDCVLALWGGWGIYGKVSKASIEAAGVALEPVLSEIEEVAKTLSAAGATALDQAWAVWKIGKLIYSAGMLEAIVYAAVGGLTPWDMLLYGAMGLAELTAAFLTDGAAIIALVVAELATLGFVASDAVKVHNACG